MNRASRNLLIPCVFAGILALSTTLAAEPFRIEVVDAETGRGVPLVELRTVNDIRLFSDSQGIVSFDEPGLLGRTVFFHVKTHGYDFPKDGFGFAGKALRTEAGGKARLELRRLNFARRLYRVTGAGIYRDSHLCGMPVPLREPLLNAQVTGSDSVVNAVYRGKIFWFWGDTNRPGYPLGNYNVPGAVSPLPGKELDPAKGIDLQYFTDETGFARSVARMPGDGPTWIHGLAVIHEPGGKERMLAAYMKIRNQLDVYQRGVAEWDDEAGSFRKVAELPLDAPVQPGGHTLRLPEDPQGTIYFSTPYPLTRVAGRVDAFTRADDFEAFTCLREGSRLEQPEIDRDDAGRARYSWKKNTPAIGPAEQAELLKSGLLRPHEALLQLRDRDTGRAVRAHSGSVYWNEFRGKFVLVTVEIGGESSHLGEVWFAEAPSPVGPWVYAVKIATHEKYSFYNPKQHPMFDADGGRTIYFEGTYTNTFSGNPEQTPRYDYNQILYQLALDDPRLMLPMAMAEGGEGPLRTGAKGVPSSGFQDIAFFAADRAGPETIPVYRADGTGASWRFHIELGQGTEKPPVAFHALPADVKSPPATTIPLYEFVSDDGGKRAYIAGEPPVDRPGWMRAVKPLCRVWKNPYRSGP